MSAWVYLALRDERLIGAGATLKDARQLCESKMAQMHEEGAYGGWHPHPEADGRRGDPNRGELVEHWGLYAIRRVPVARFDGEGGGRE